LIDAVSLNNAAIATSGLSPRDCIGDRYRSTTISPFIGHPVREVISASVVASHAADADAIATACMVLRPDESIGLVDKLDGVAARITEANGRVHQSARWTTLQLVGAASSHATVATEAKPSADNTATDKKTSLPPELRWPADWELGITYTEPEVKERDADFRQPYIALWITDAQNKVVNTIFLLGKDAQYHHDNFIWWGSYNERAEHEVDLRSQGTTLSGRYRLFWIGVDDEWNRVPIGKYTLHLETSQEHGKHSYRTIPIEIGRERFKMSIPNLEDSGGLDITYGHYNDRFKSDG
jgi:thiamine biosynthesis lipoprotein